jgi:M6 family metalloprotease-like protein
MKMMNIIISISTIASLLLFTGCSNGGGSDGVEETYLTPTSPPGDTSLDSVPEIIDESEAIPLLVIQLEYSDITFTHNAATWSNKIFGNQFHQLNDYYHEISMGKFVFSRVEENYGIENDGVIAVRLNKDHPDSGYSSDIHPDLKLAVLKAGDYVDFSPYDTNGDGLITPDEMLIVFIVAGYEEAYGEVTPSVWAHQSCVSSVNTPIADGVNLMGCAFGGNYALFGERHGRYDIANNIVAHDATVGIIAHELGHAAFKLLDLYPTDPTVTSVGIGYFGLMGAGNWAQAGSNEEPGETPVHMCAWSKLYTKKEWVDPEIISEASDTVVLNESSSSNYNIVKLPINDNEYFLLENRNNSGYDQGLYSLNGSFYGGMAIWHVDESVIAAKRASNTVNNDETHKGVDLEEAAEANLDFTIYVPENTLYPGDEKNLYYADNVDTFSPDTDPNSDSYASGETRITVENISARSEVMYADVTNPN